jgi:ABC-type nitrate/sulfonate/bicarbonate transport system substrate-binding protein
VEKIRFPYRSNTHLLLLHVIAESGSWEKHGLEVEYDYKINSKDAHDLVMSGDVEFVGGNHVSPYGHRARGDKWLYIGQTVNTVAGRRLVVRPESGINSIADLREKVVGSRGAHPQLNDWLQLKQNGLDVDRDEVKIVGQYGSQRGPIDARDPAAEKAVQPLWQWVRDKKVDAAFLGGAEPLVAAQAGLKIIELPPFPMIYYTTVSTSLSFAEKNPDLIERFLKGMIEGIHFFKTQPERAAKIIQERYEKSGKLDLATARTAQQEMAAILEPRLYPTPAAIANVYQEGVRQDKDAARINPMALWDLHYLRRIDDSGFVDELYAKAPDAGTAASRATSSV